MQTTHHSKKEGVTNFRDAKILPLFYCWILKRHTIFRDAKILGIAPAPRKKTCPLKRIPYFTSARGLG